MAVKDNKQKLIGSILVLCSQNTVRSPMLEAFLKQALGKKVYVRSAGVENALLNPLAVEVMYEEGIDISGHVSESYEDLPPDSYDLILALSEPAYELAREIAREQAADIEYWSTSEPPRFAEESRETTLSAMRQIRDELKRHLENRFDLALNKDT